jgi:group I intron endonuclease
MIGIYKITSPSGRIYIGQSKNIKQRFITYNCLYNSRKQVLLNRSFLKYGVKNHTFEIKEECNYNLLNFRERYWQEYYNVLEDGLNLCLVSTKEKKHKHSKETLKKISNTHKGKKLSKKHIEAIVNSRKGKKLTKEHIRKLTTAPKTLSHRCKPIVNIENGIFYDTIREASESLNLNRNTLKGLLNGSAKYENKTPFRYE